MATKNQTATHAAFLRGKKRGIRLEDQRALTVAGIIILLLLFLILAQLFGWWPYHKERLGTAFYSDTSSVLPLKEGVSADGTTTNDSQSSNNNNSGSNGSNGANGASGTNGSNGSNGSNGNNGGGGSETPDDNALIDLAAGIDVGDSFAEISAQSTGLSPNCSTLADISASIAGTQKVCVYTQGDKLVTVTYLNDKVISASKTGF